MNFERILVVYLLFRYNKESINPNWRLGSFSEFWTKMGYLNKNYKYRLKTKIMSKLVCLNHVSIHTNNAVITCYDIEIIFKLISKSMTVALENFVS